MQERKINPLVFSDDFFLAEDREGFHVTGLMKRVWATQLHVLAEIDRICNKYNLTWFADWGTLLGAVRHKGFIPWDDDIDICMPRQDYDIFHSVLKDELGGEYNWLDPFSNEDVFRHFFLRVVNTRYINFDEGSLERFYGVPYSCGVDIFPIDGVPDDDEEWELLKSIVNNILYAGKIIEDQPENDIEEFITEIEKLCGVTLDRKKNIKTQLTVLADALCRSYNFGETKRAVCVSEYALGEGKTLCNTSWFKQSIRVPYENWNISIPKEYNEVLTALFGADYMVPVRGTQSHEYPFYKKQKKLAKEKIGIAGWEDREKRVAKWLNLDETEIFEYKLLKKNETMDAYYFFCQSEMKAIWIPHDENKEPILAEIV
ncbi:MAG: LicD family protein [Lachnospiraceae bacterium]|nr:LicD family protein [Lachnospiraceae bacterium]